MIDVFKLLISTSLNVLLSEPSDKYEYLEDLIEGFEITEVQKAGAIFDVSKLDYLNAQHMANLSHKEFINYLNPFLIELGIDINEHEKKDLLIESMRTSENTLKGVASSLICYFKNVNTYNEKAIEKFITSNQLLIDLKDKINNLEPWDESSLDNLLLQYREEHELSVPKVNQPLRIALTGSTNSPSLGLTLYLFNKQEVLKRLDQLIEYLHTKN